MKKHFIFPAASVMMVMLSLHYNGTAQDLPMAKVTVVNVSKNINTDVIGEPLNLLVNTKFREYGPMPSKDNMHLYFSRQGDPENTGGEGDEDIWQSDFDEQTQSWLKAINIGAPLNNKGPNFICGIGANGDTLLLGNVYAKRGRMLAGVSISMRTGNSWSFPQALQISSDYNFSTRAGFDLSHDRMALIIAQEKLDSKGQLDLYVALRDMDAKYPYSGKESINLGPIINTQGIETSPWLSYDGRTLYFSSDGHGGYGKLDIFVSRRLDDTWTNWSEPTNLGPGINSAYDDRSFNFNPDGRYAYYSRGLTPFNSDIYRVEMTRLFKGLEDSVYYNGTINLGPEIGQAHVVSNVFDMDQAEIKNSSKPALMKIIEYLKQNKNIIVKVNAHSNQHASRNESLKLSNQRADNVMNLMVESGIAQSRLSFQGLGHDIVINTKDLKTGSVDIESCVEFKFINFNSR